MNKKLEGIIKRVSTRRLELNMSYQDIADKTGLSKSTLQRYETGSIGKLGLDKLEILAYALQVSPAYLMGWTDSIDGSVELKADEKISGISKETEKYIEQLPADAIEELNKYVKLLAQAYLKDKE